MPLRLRNKLNSQFHFAVSSPIAVEVLHLIRNPIIHTRSHIRTVDAKVLLRLLFFFDVTHDQAHALYGSHGVNSPTLHM